MNAHRSIRQAGVLYLALLVTATFAATSGSALHLPSLPALGEQSNNPYLGGWVNATSAVSPPAVGGGMMAFSTKASQFVLFGGSDGEPTNSTWVLDLHGGMWGQVHPILSPPVRVDGMFAYDSAADAFVLFGGWYESPSGAYLRWDDTWAFYPSNDTWAPRHPAVSPSPRSDGAFAYDSADDVTFLVGGFNGTAYLGDEWAYTFANDSWWPRPSLVMPSPRADGRMVYDPNTDAFYLYGGNDYSGPNFTYHHLGDTWRYSWTRRQWTPLFPTVTPGSLDYAVLAADTKTGVLLMSGGYGASVVLGDTWVFNTTRIEWGKLTTLVSPSPRMAAVGGYDPVAGQFVVFSGGDTVSAKDDTWLLDYPPIFLASVSASTTEAIMGTVIDFSGQIFGGTGFLASASWSFGDGSAANGTKASHAFSAPGVYTVDFLVMDDRGMVAGDHIQVSIGIIGPLWAAGAAVGATLAIALAAVVVLRRRRGRSPPIVRGADGGPPREDIPLKGPPRKPG